MKEANRSYIFVYMSKGVFILLQTLLHICSGRETTLLRAAKDPQLDRLDKLSTAVNQLETTGTSSNVQQNVASCAEPNYSSAYVLTAENVDVFVVHSTKYIPKRMYMSTITCIPNMNVVASLRKKLQRIRIEQHVRRHIYFFRMCMY